MRCRRAHVGVAKNQLRRVPAKRVCIDMPEAMLHMARSELPVLDFKGSLIRRSMLSVLEYYTVTLCHVQVVLVLPASQKEMCVGTV